MSSFIKLSVKETGSRTEGERVGGRGWKNVTRQSWEGLGTVWGLLWAVRTECFLSTPSAVAVP